MSHQKRFLFCGLLLAVLAAPLFAAPPATGGPKGPKEPPSVADVAYGKDPRQKLDIYLPPGSGPFPVLIWYHGGGWFAGDKVTGAFEPAPLLKVGCAMVSAEYRLVKDASAEGIVPPVAAVLGDNRRALQYVRLHAADWHLDPDRIIVAGGSAGGGTAIYLGSEGEQANPGSPDPVERVSTKVQGVIGLAAAPTTLDPQRIREWNPGVVWGYWCFEPDATNYNSLPEFEKWLADRDKCMPYIQKYSSDLLLKKGAPPFFLQYGQALPAPGTTPSSSELVHSPRWGLAFQKLAKERGVEVDVQYPGHPPENYKNMWEFLYHQLGLSAK
jgi:acetyl esterase/lipase